ncbi:hypothetical protein BaRGS_00026011 [Batillaria attramentaria]|uniref:B30.2/SPRY domain-containing protein n=1 Tax=Batillaria attramentaria TaxID=370345 RepID=A0ABD0K749_9CAEN
MASLGHDRLSKEDVSFCNCARNGKGKECRCGEEEQEFTWSWDQFSTTSDSTLQEDGREVIFHANYSSGTAAIRGTTPFREGHHFWEIKMTTPVYGTDMMVGVATADLNLDKYVHTFCSLLGRDNNSWGLSYLGTVHHKGQTRTFSDKLGQGAIVGVHLDMWQGTLSFYVNRRPLGVAYRGLQGKSLYPVVTSTAARSGMKVITTKWFPHSLQFQCCQTLRSYVQKDMYVLDAVSLPPGLNVFLKNNLGWLLRSYPSFPAAVASPLWRYRHIVGSPFGAATSEDRCNGQPGGRQNLSDDQDSGGSGTDDESSLSCSNGRAAGSLSGCSNTSLRKTSEQEQGNASCSESHTGKTGGLKAAEASCSESHTGKTGCLKAAEESSSTEGDYVNVVQLSPKPAIPSRMPRKRTYNESLRPDHTHENVDLNGTLCENESGVVSISAEGDAAGNSSKCTSSGSVEICGKPDLRQERVASEGLEDIERGECPSKAKPGSSKTPVSGDVSCSSSCSSQTESTSGKLNDEMKVSKSASSPDRKRKKTH